MYIQSFLKTHRVPVLSESEIAALDGAVARTTTYRPNDVLVHENVPLTQCTLILRGFVHRYKETVEGRRQILAIHVPGDFVDLHSYPLKHLEHSVASTTEVEVAIFPHSSIRELTAQSTILTELLWRSTLIDAAINREWLVSIGARAAIVRIAHLFCELQVRLARVGLGDDRGYALPITQIDIADAVGLTPVHTNRMLRELRAHGLAEFREKRVTIHDLAALRKFAEFDTGYLFLNGG